MRMKTKLVGPKPPTEKELEAFRAMLAILPRNWVALPDDGDIYLTTRDQLEAADPATYGIIYADDAQGKAIARFVVDAPDILERLLTYLDQMRELFTYLDVAAANDAMGSYLEAQKGRVA